MKLEDWFSLNKGRVKRKDFARAIGVKPQTVTGYCNGSFPPSIAVATKIAMETDGAVTPNDFMIPAPPKAEPMREAAE